ncbi:MAG: hypothetical protein HOQ22_02315 [Nocardioidaceae bacterium]|nr:hypothetical protein [Nocardioidaceae bacterium]NUS49859.1 hypothetical protein [Nocardioidaceae bacterium]
MATSRIVEEERGVYRGGRTHRHNGYWAGDFAALGTAGPTRPMRPGTAHRRNPR